MTAAHPDVLADPIGVIVGLVSAVEPTLDAKVIETVATGVAGGRAKRRKLAQALVERPSVLTDGRSPAPRGIGDLLIALRKAGAETISPPVCTECGKLLRTLQRRGDNWYCGVCGPVREPCAACGNTRRVHSRDRAGQPRCVQCPPDDGQDPTEIIVAIVVGIDPSLPVETAAAAVNAAAPQAGQRHKLAWSLQDQPELLTGAGAQTSVPSVLRLIDRLCEAGATRIVHPACPHCHRVMHLHRRIGDTWLCRNCVAKSRAQPCTRCGSVREAATRDEHGQPLCPFCLITNPVNQEICISCRRRRPVSIRTDDGPLCPTCRPLKTMTCSICGRHAPGQISKATGQPWCQACQQRWDRCSRCGQVQPIRAGTRTEPLCITCAKPDTEFDITCPTCGQTVQLHRSGPCVRCVIDQRITELLTDGTGQIRPELQALHHSLVNTDHPSTVLGWLGRSAAPAILRDLGNGARPLSHAALDELPASKPLKHLRSMLVATGALPARDEHMVQLERWISHTIDQRQDPDERQLLHRYAVWHMLRRLRHRTSGDTTHSQHATIRQQLRGAIVLLDHLTAQGLTLHTARQGDLDAWLADENSSHLRGAGHFVRWAKKHKLTSLDLPAIKWGGPTAIIDTETRWDQARLLLHDNTHETEDRVAGLLVLLYAQWPSAISRLTVDRVQISDDRVRLRLGHEPIVLPEPLAGLVRQLLDSRRGHAALAEQGTSPWLFPGGQPGRPISNYQLTERLRQLGLRPAESRSTALFQLATEVPAAVLARMLGIHIAVAVAWQRASAGDWTDYAAHISRRNET